MKILTRTLSGLILICFLFSQTAWAQTTTRTYETKYKLRKAYNFKHSHGISANNNTGWTKIAIEVKTKNNYTFGSFHGQVTLYKAHILPADANNGLKSRGNPESYFFMRWGIGWVTNDAPSNSRTFFHKQAYAVDTRIANPYWKKWGHDNIDAIATVTVEGGGSLRDIKEIRVPGSDPWDGGHFVHYTNPCTGNPTYAGCDAVADFKNVSNATNKKAIIIAHRGYHGMRGVPENSLAAVQKAYDEKFRYVEVDLRMTKDNVPIIFHDDFLGYATDYPVLNNTNTSTFTEENNWSTVDDFKYRDRYWDKLYRTATNAGNAYVRTGEVTNNYVNSFSQICDYISGKDIMLYLDIKSVPTNRNLEVMKHCLHIAVEKNVLHQIAVKMIRTNSGAPPDKQLVMPVATAEEQLGGIYHKLKSNLNVHIVDYAPDEGTSFITGWINEGNVVGFEFDSQNADGMFKAPAFDSKIFPGGLSVWEYTKAQGYRTGIWSSTNLDPRGRPGHDPSKWGTGNVMNQTTNNRLVRYKDIRSRMEIQAMVAPQYLTHDRPDTWESYLRAVGLFNTNSKR